MKFMEIVSGKVFTKRSGLGFKIFRLHLHVPKTGHDYMRTITAGYAVESILGLDEFEVHF